MDVRIERLPAMRVASARAVGPAPEMEAWARLRAWAEPAGLLSEPAGHPVFGFNNPNPSPEKAEYGYEFWIGIDPDTVCPAGIDVQEFAGGRYAVATCGLTEVPEKWKQLWEWVKRSEYRWRDTHELEGIRNPLGVESALVLDLYLPIED